MKKRVLLVIFLIVGAAIAGTLTRPRETSTGSPAADQRKEISESYKLDPGAQVEVSGINGKVEVQTAETDTAEIHIERTGSSDDALSRRQIIIEHTSTSLVIRSEQKSHASFWSFWGSTPRENVTLKLPRRISLRASGVNGHVTIGEVGGDVNISGINGKVEIAQVNGYAEISGINGGVMMAVKQLGERGLKISGVNGRIELRLNDGLNADFQAKGMNGSVSSEMPDIVIQKDDKHSNYSARIGTGGAPISLSNVNGGVRLTRGAV